MNPFLFIVGCPRSGTTLLQRMLDAHNDLAIIHETMWIPEFVRDRALVDPDGTARPDLISAVAHHPRFPALGLSQEDLKAVGDGQPLSYAAFVSGVFDLYGRARGKPLVGDKSPQFVRHLHLLHELWPTAKFVHIIRDGRDVALSVSEWKKSERNIGRFSTWREDPVTTTALWWKRKVRFGRETGDRLGRELYLEILYESLVANPADELEAICSFLGIPFDSAMPDFHLGRTRRNPGLGAKRAWLPPTPGLRDWRTQMRAEDVDRFEAAAGDLLEDLGYERAFVEPSSAARSQAATIGRRFWEDA